MKYYFITTFLLVHSILFSQNASLKDIRIPYNSRDIVIDGSLDEWNQYFKYHFADTGQKLNNTPGHQLMAFYDESYDYTGVFLPQSRNIVEARICWDLNNLYFGFIVDDGHLWAQNKLGDKYPNLHLNDGIEIYIDSKNDSREKMDINDYQFMIDISGLNLVFRGDREMLALDSLTAPKKSGQNIYFQYKTIYSGILNDTITDEGFVVEVMIPFAAIGLTVKTGMKLRIELCNNDNDYNLDGVDTYEEKAKRYWPFTWLGYSDFGYPETWIEAELTGEPDFFDHLSGSKIRRWFSFYALVFLVTIIIISLLLVRMRKLKRLPLRTELESSKVIFLEKQEIDPGIVADDNSTLLKKAAVYVSENYYENMGSEKLAQHLCISLRKLQRITREELDATPTNFIYMVKLNLAADYLKKHKGNISETAYEFGFSDPGYFSKLFKKHFGMSPAEFLENNDNK